MAKRTSAINWKMLLRVIGWLLYIEAAFMLVPLVTSYCYGDRLLPFIAAIAITVAAGTAATLCVRPSRYDMGKRDGFLLTGLVWVVFSVFGMIPFILCSHHLSVTDAFFEAMSGFTTTGGSIIRDIDSLNHGINLWRCQMQWIGGMGIILFTLAVLPMLNSSGGMQMFNAEVTGITHEKLRPRVSSTAKRLWLVYFLLTIALAGLYWLGPMNFFDSICHAMSTMSTGGFSTKNASINAWNSNYVKVVSTVFMFVGAVNFALIFKASTGNFKAVWRNVVFRYFVGLILVMFLFFDLVLYFNPNVEHTVELFTIDSMFMIISTLSSTGYVVDRLMSWGPLLVGVTIVMVLIGGCAGSTAGGAKIDRIIVFGKNAHRELSRCIYPNHIMPVEMEHKVISPEIVNKTMVFLALYAGVILVGGLLLTLFGAPLKEGLLAAYSCISNSSMDMVVFSDAPAYTYVADPGKWIMGLLMLIGRLEVFTILLLFLPRFWRR